MGKKKQIRVFISGAVVGVVVMTALDAYLFLNFRKASRDFYRTSRHITEFAQAMIDAGKEQYPEIFNDARVRRALEQHQFDIIVRSL
jgi:hypothetical protein